VALVISLNAQRRDLTPGQRALAAARCWGLDGYSKGGRKSNKQGETDGNSSSYRSLARQFRTDGKYVAYARDLLAESPDLASRVEAGEPLATVYKALEERRQEAKNRERAMERLSASLPLPAGRRYHGGSLNDHEPSKSSTAARPRSMMAPTTKPMRTPEEQRILDWAAETEGKEFVEKHEHLILEQARAMGELSDTAKDRRSD
jgi:hypothetical protein